MLNERYSDRPAAITLTLEGIADTDAQLPLVIADRVPSLHVEGGTLLTPRQASSQEPALLVHFPPGEGWKTITVTLTW